MSDSESLENIGKLAMLEHAAWKTRNMARFERSRWLRKYLGETGDHFCREDLIGNDDHNDIPAFDAMTKSLNDAQKKLTAARAATRRAIVKSLP